MKWWRRFKQRQRRAVAGWKGVIPKDTKWDPHRYFTRNQEVLRVEVVVNRELLHDAARAEDVAKFASRVTAELARKAVLEKMADLANA